jgi:hypothetical protein
MDPFEAVLDEVDSAVHAVGADKVAKAIPELERVHATLKVDPTAKNKQNQTFIHYAISFAVEGGGTNVIPVVDFYLSKGVDINAQGSGSGRTALHYAAQHGKLYLVQELLKRGADPALKSKTGETPLRQAIDNGHEIIARLLTATQGKAVTPKWMGDPSYLAKKVLRSVEVGSRAHPLPETTYTLADPSKSEPLQPRQLTQSAIFPKLTGVGRKTRKHGYTRLRRRTRGRVSRRKITT